MKRLVILMIFVLGFSSYAGVVKEDEIYITRKEWNEWKKEFSKTLNELEYNAHLHMQDILSEYEQEGKLDDIRIWVTATQSGARKKVLEENDNGD